MHPRTSRLGLHFAPTYRVSHPLNFSFTFSQVLTQHQYRQMLRRWYLQKCRRIQLLHQHRNRPNLRPDPHPHGLAPASHNPDTHRSRRDLEFGFVCLGSGYLQDAYAVQLLQDYGLVRGWELVLYLAAVRSPPSTFSSPIVGHG
jgi:hypothetical protein